ncbi:MAG TPA: hypothetical protein VNB49_13245, partial [Candidatus Dormibacteraeota bacterium]|nr:hypothetical protein [Candidatus Dormibacteraeota bacterium]
RWTRTHNEKRAWELWAKLKRDFCIGMLGSNEAVIGQILAAINEACDEALEEVAKRLRQCEAGGHTSRGALQALAGEFQHASNGQAPKGQQRMRDDAERA